MKINKISIVVILILIVMSMGLISSHGEENFSQAEEIIKQKISCENLTEDQLEILGDYFMEQMHSGEAHEIMDERMGGGGSESLRQVHINMGLAFYCGDSGGFSSEMMNMMMGRGMMESYYNNNLGRNNNILLGVVLSLVIIALSLSIFLLIKKIQNPNNKIKRK